MVPEDQPTAKEQVVTGDSTTIGEQSFVQEQIITMESAPETVPPSAEASSTAEKSTGEEPAAKEQVTEEEQPATEEIPVSIGSVIPEQVTEEPIAKEQATEVEQPLTGVPPITEGQTIETPAAEEPATEEQSATDEQVVTIEKSPLRMPAALIVETSKPESEAGPSHLPTGKEAMLESASKQIEDIMEISDEERELAAQDEPQSPDSTDKAQEELHSSLFEVFYQTLRTSLNSLLKGSKMPFGSYKKVLIGTLDNIAELGGADKVGPYKVLIEDYEKQVIEWHTLTNRSLTAWVQEEIDNLKRINEESRLKAEAESRTLQQTVQKFKTREDNIKSENEFNELELKTLQSRLTILSGTIRKQKDIIAKAQATIDNTQKAIEKIQPEAASLEQKIKARTTELADIQISEQQAFDELSEVNKKLEQLVQFDSEELRKQAKAQATERRNQELARIENSLRHYVENPL